jgi:amino acid adenylation domain-containing protein
MITETISGFRLSPHQKRLWLLQKESGAAYVAQSVICIEGNLKPEVLKAALQNIVNRHQILRTTFHCLPGMKIPVMVVKDSSVLSWREIYLSKDNSQNITITSICQEEKSHLFDFEKGPLLRCSLLELSANKHILVVTLPALCADARTLKNLFAEISDSYSACLQGEDCSKEVVQYVQFSEWQNDLLEDSEAEAGKNYWSQQDFSALDTLTLPFADNFYQKTEFQPQVYTFTLSAHLTQEIKTNHRGAETRGGEGLNSNLVSLFLLSCWQILLWRFTGQTEMIVGKVCHGREYEELNDVLGLFAKSLPIRSRLNTDLHFSEVLQQVTQAVEEANEWQEDFIFEKNVESFPFIFEFEQLPEKCLASDTLFSFDTQYICLEPFQIKLSCIDKEEFLELGFYYNANLFSANAIHRLAEQFQTLLTSAIENPDVAISQLQILPPNQLEQLLIDFNQTQVDSPRNKCIHQLFEEQVTLTPDKIAVVFEDKQLTYSELNQSANQLAHYLQKLGVQPDSVVGICLERSHLMIVAMLGVLKAGGAYLPLDPGLPKEAIAFRLQDAQVPIVLTQQGIDSIQNSRVVCLDTDWKDIARESTENTTSQATPENLVYVIYTSGSTGKPKGVAIEHQQLCNYLYGILEKLELPKDASFATVSTFAADLGNTVIFPCLRTGGCLHVVSWERASDAAALAAYFRRHPIDCLKIVPSHISALLTSSDIESILPRQLLILGGEATDWHLVETIQQYAPYCRIINHYGPTETTVGVLTYTLSPQPALISGDLKAATVPIGRPIANTQVYVLDKQLQPVPIGVPGELYIGGKSLARSYLNRPELTADRFIANPFVDFKLDRLYKTGDLVRYLPDGNLEFLHRLDDQVKIRGFRIELGEISAVLSQHPAVQEVVVVAREDGLGDKRLVAYIVPSVPNTQHLTLTGDLRSLLKEKLPEYMIPSAFVVLKALPLTSNGKIDRHALPAPDEAALIEKTFVAPRTPVEEVIAAMWAQLLGVQRLSIDDNFFDLGGHSLLATQVISRLRTAFGVEIPLRQLFASPTVAGLAAHIETAMRAGQELETTAIPRAAKDKDLPLSFAQWRLWFLNQLEPESPSYNLPRVIRLTGPLNIAALEQSFNEVIKRHEVLRTTFARVNGQPMQVIHPKMVLRLSILDCITIPQSQIQNFILEEVQQGFDLAKGPLLRAKLLQVGEQEHLLLLTMHHIVSDAWSTGVLIEQMAALYTAYCEGKPSPLPELPIQYADFAVWQREWLQGEQLQALLDYWKQQLQGDLPVLELPADRPRPSVQTFAGKEHSFVLSKELTEALKTLSQQQGVTLFMTLLAAFKTLLYRYTGQEDILIGSPIANRNRGEIESLIGFFVNTLVLRTDLFGNPSFQELLGRVREVTLGAYAHQDLPFEKLVEELQPERNLSHAPLFQVMFVFQNAPMKTLELPGLSIQPLKVNSGTAKFDLTLSMQDTEQGLIATFEYNTDLFDEATISRYCGHFQTLLASIVANPQQRLSELPLLTATEQQQLVEWNNTKTEYGNELCLHQLFEAQVERTPDAVAVVYENEQLTYQELNQRANQLAHYLQKLGVGPEVLVGICLERSLQMVIALLGILKAGGAYVPLDPAYPSERFAFMLEDSQVSVLLTQEKLVAMLPENQAKVVCLDRNWQEIAKESDHNSINKANPENLVYAIYTSGSTGRPKGVQITHGALVNFLNSMRLTPGLSEKDILLSVTTLSFDIAALELYLPLSVGARLVVVSREVAADGTQLLEKLASSGVTVMQATPATWRLLLAAGWQGSWQLKILCGGEALDRELANQLLARATEVWNLYGPTETTIWSSVQKVESKDGIVSIGRPITNTQFYILDSHQQLVPVGVPGELHIGGAGVARGYINQPELTAVKFIPNPYLSGTPTANNNQPGAGLYKTGDLVRYQPDGTLEFLGRIDNQVKVRGFRIEVGEIEAVLAQHLAVRETVVLAREAQPGDKQLVAYVVPNNEQTPTTSELRNFLLKQLPEYMVPSVFVILEALPLTPNGKVNRQALPAPEPLRPELEAAYVMPQTELEQTIATVWQKALNIENIGIHDNFFELGGHSLLLVKVNSQLREIFKTELPLLEMFRYPTISSLAEYFSRSQNQTSSFTETDIQTEKLAAGKALQKKRLQKMKSTKG